LVSEGRVVYLAGTGLLTGQEILDAKTKLLRESDRLKGLNYGLIDLTDVTELRVTRDDVGIARMWEAFAEVTRWNTHGFRSRAEADPWLRPWAEGRLPAEPSS
jgi:hypothetical protein